MSFALASLKRVGPQCSNAPTIWTYASGADALTAVDLTGFFNAVAAKLKVGDVIYVTPTSGAAGLLRVDTNTRDLTASPPVAGVVDTLNALSLGTTDSD